jgi:hypothetical protein
MHPHHRVTNVEPGVLNGDGHAVVGARAAEGEQVAARLQNAQALTPQLDAVRDAR